jgi:outer membrane biogenesis lipoprotein LolB
MNFFACEGLRLRVTYTWRLFFCLVLASMSLGGCATLNSLSTPTTVTQQSLPLISARTEFNVSGRFSAKRESNQASGQFRYAQKGSDRTLEVFAPTGTPMARIDADASTAKLTMANGEVRTASTLADLLQTFIDIRVTDAQFSSWMQALPLLDAQPDRDAQGRIERFRESAWMIEIGARMDGNAGFARRMRWAFTPENDTEIRWVIDEFSAP